MVKTAGFIFLLYRLYNCRLRVMNEEYDRLQRDFFTRDVLEVAPELPGKFLCLDSAEGISGKYMITEVEAYRGEDDKACHASRGITQRNRIMYEIGGSVYMYLIYGIYWMLNIVTSEKGNPQAVLIRGIRGFQGPGKLTRDLKIDGSFYGDDVCTSKNLWFEDHGIYPVTAKGRRIGIDYAGPYWRDIEWRFYVR